MINRRNKSHSGYSGRAPRRPDGRGRIRVMRKDTSSTRPTKAGTSKGRPRKRMVRMSQPPPRRRINNGQAAPMKIKPLDSRSDIIRIIPLGGVEEIGKNMTVVEYKDSIIVVDMGLQFSDEETPGVDYIVPDVSYLEKNKKKIKGVFITHGHLDHIGGIPFIQPKIGNPVIYTRLLTAIMIKKRQEEFKHLPKLHLEIVEKNKSIRIGKGLSVEFFNVSHSIPDSMGLKIKTPHGNILFTGDLKIDHKDGKPSEHEEKVFGDLGKEKNLLLLSDSTNIDREGWSFPESEAQENIKKLLKSIEGRLIIGTFASQLTRIIFIIETAEKLGKKVVIDGRSMKTNVEIAKELGLLKAKKSTFITSEQMANYPSNKIIVLATGAQGDEFASLMRMGNKTNKKIILNKTDTVALSSSVIPGNEKAVQRLKDNIARQGTKIIINNTLTGIHSSGHGNKEELRWMESKIKPKFLIPIHGFHHFLRLHAEMSKEFVEEKNIIIPDNGSVIELYDKGSKIRKLPGSVSPGKVMVDALGDGDVKDVVVRDRQMLSQDGIFVVIATIDINTGKVRKSPDIISRGFVYMKEAHDLLRQARVLTKKTIEEATAQMHPINFDYIKNLVREKVAKLLLQKTGRRPIVLPVILEV